MILHESLACNVPVIATSLSGLAENFQEGVNGFLFKMEEFRRHTSKVYCKRLRRGVYVARIDRGSQLGAIARMSALSRTGLRVVFPGLSPEFIASISSATRDDGGLGRSGEKVGES